MSEADPQALFLEGWAAHQKGDLLAARALYDAALALAPQHFDALHLSGVAAAQSDDIAAAAVLIGRALSVNGNNPVVHFNYAGVLEKLERWDDACAAYGHAIALQPDYLQAHINRANVLLRQARFAAAVEGYAQVLAVAPDHAEAAFHRGRAYAALARHQEALADYERAMTLGLGGAAIAYHRATALRALGMLDAAFVGYGDALRLHPKFPEALVDRGTISWMKGDASAALDDYDRAIALAPQVIEAHINRAVALRALGRQTEALASIDRALALKPDHAGAHNNRGAVLTDLGDPAAALASFDRALQLQPTNVDALNNRGAAQEYLGQHAAALASYEAALKLRPEHPDANLNRATVLKALGQAEASAAGYAEARRLRPQTPFLAGMHLLAKLQICDWSSYDADVAEVVAGVMQGNSVTPSFQTLVVTDSPALQRRAAEIWTHVKNPRNDALGPIPVRPKSDKIRVAYFSADFRNHPVASLTAELFETHDRRKFETYAFSFGPETGDAMQARLRKAFDHFIDVRDKPVRAIAELSRSYQIDIAVDLAGYTADARCGIFALRAAPVQINFLGYPGTMGTDFMDYIVADATLIPAVEGRHYAEKVIQLPCFQPNDTRRLSAAQTPSRVAVGLPQRGFVFCCFNNAYKLTPRVLDVWARILHRVEGSVLWLSANNEAATRNLKAEAVQRGIAPERLIFAQRVPTAAEHLARHRLADLFLDTWPYNAHTTASDALWAGLPVLTRRGNTYAGRVAASLLAAMGMEELIVDDESGYETAAVALASNFTRVTDLKRKLAAARDTSKLFDVQGFTAYLEQAYTEIHMRSCAGLTAVDIIVAG